VLGVASDLVLAEVKDLPQVVLWLGGLWGQESDLGLARELVEESDLGLGQVSDFLSEPAKVRSQVDRGLDLESELRSELG